MKHPRLKLSALLALALLVLAPLAPAAEDDPAAPPVTHHKTLFAKLKEGGWVMIPIGLCSVLTLYLIGDGIIRTGRKRVIPDDQLTQVRGFFQQGDYVNAYEYCRSHPSPLTSVVQAGISGLGEGKTETEEAIHGELVRVNSSMTTYISYLSVIGVCTPMIGLLGTVTGMIRAFETLGTSGIGDPSSLSAAIGEVLVATASGLFIAIPAFGAFYFLRNRATKVVYALQIELARLFRRMPYQSLAGVHIGGEDLYAAEPNWIETPAASAQS